MFTMCANKLTFHELPKTSTAGADEDRYKLCVYCLELIEILTQFEQQLKLLL